MFTGIIAETCQVKNARKTADGLLLTFARPKKWKDLQTGESINTDGVCLTVVAIRPSEYDCLLMPETLQKSTFGRDTPNEVSLERSLSTKDRFGGHFVQGHVDTISKVTKIEKSDGWRVQLELPARFKNLVAGKGSIAVNGVSLTISDVQKNSFGVALIPYTLKHTTLGHLQAGDFVNLEFDIIGKYIARSLDNAKS